MTPFEYGKCPSLYNNRSRSIEHPTSLSLSFSIFFHLFFLSLFLFSFLLRCEHSGKRGVDEVQWNGEAKLTAIPGCRGRAYHDDGFDAGNERQLVPPASGISGRVTVDSR